MPLSYSRHTSRFLSVWLGTLPFVLPGPPLLLPPVAFVASWALLAIEDIGHIIEEPFNMPFASTADCPRTTLNMEATCDAVKQDVLAIAGIPALGAAMVIGTGASTLYAASP